MIKKIVNNKFLIVLWIMIAAYALYFSLYTINRHQALNSHYFDLGIMNQVVHNTSQGRVLGMNNFEKSEQISRLAVHNDPLLALLAPFYLIYDGPETLLVIQSVVLALGALGIYLISMKYRKSPILAVTFSFVYLMYPAIQRPNLYDFHAVTLSTTFIIFMVYFAIRHKYKWSIFFLILALLGKENVGFTTGMFGLLLAIQTTKFGKRLRIIPKTKIKDRRFGIFIFLMSVTWSLLSFLVIIPYFRGGEHFAVERYTYLGDSPIQIAATAITQPGLVVSHLMDNPPVTGYVYWMLIPVAGLSFLVPQYFLIMIPELAINLLSTNWATRNIYHQYNALITPFVFLSAIAGATGLINKIRKKYVEHTIILFIIAFTMFASFTYGPLPFSKERDESGWRELSTDALDVRLWAKRINKHEGIVVSATSSIAPHFSGRENFFRFSSDFREADYVFIHRNDTSNDWYDAEDIDRALSDLETHPDFEKIYHRLRFEVYRKKTSDYDINNL